MTVAIHWQDEPESVTERYERLEKLRHLAETYDLLLQEEARPVAIALFGQPSLTFHLGLDQPHLATSDWYRQPGHPYVQAIAQLLDKLVNLPHVHQLEFLVSSGADPLTSLQIQLDRQSLSADTLPSAVCNQLETQKIYSFEN